MMSKVARLWCWQGKIGQVDVDRVTDPLRQIVPTLLDVAYTTDEVVLRTTGDDDRPTETVQQESVDDNTGRVVASTSTDEQQNINDDSLTAESVVEELKSTTMEAGQSTSDISSVPEVTLESDPGAAGHALDKEEL